MFSKKNPDDRIAPNEMTPETVAIWVSIKECWRLADYLSNGSAARLFFLHPAHGSEHKAERGNLGRPEGTDREAMPEILKTR